MKMGSILWLRVGGDLGKREIHCKHSCPVMLVGLQKPALGLESTKSGSPLITKQEISEQVKTAQQVG